MSKRPVLLVKVGGNDLEKDGFVPSLAQAIAHYAAEYDCAVVHGGGRSIDEMMRKLDLSPAFVDGQRVTDADTLRVTEMVLSGQVNKQLVRALQTAGLDAFGMSGVDGGLLQVEPWSAERPLVGRVLQVRLALLHNLWQMGITPVISPVSIGPAGTYNVNADHAAGAIAGALQAEQAAFITNTPGVLEQEQIVPRLSASQVQQMIEAGVIYGGMIPKVQAALAALDFGAQAALICDLQGFTDGRGTVIERERENHA